jgi:hypothetical protein
MKMSAIMASNGKNIIIGDEDCGACAGAATWARSMFSVVFIY